MLLSQSSITSDSFYASSIVIEGTKTKLVFFNCVLKRN